MNIEDRLLESVYLGGVIPREMCDAATVKALLEVVRVARSEYSTNGPTNCGCNFCRAIYHLDSLTPQSNQRSRQQ